MHLPAVFGKIVYIVGYPIFRFLIKGTHRAYVVVIVDDTILLTKNWLGRQNKWRLPGGGVHKSEASINAVVRELYEEVGITANTTQLTQLTTSSIKAQFAYDYDLYTLTLLALPQFKPDKKEILSAEFINKSDLHKLPLSEEATNALTLMGWYK